VSAGSGSGTVVKIIDFEPKFGIQPLLTLGEVRKKVYKMLEYSLAAIAPVACTIKVLQW